MRYKLSNVIIKNNEKIGRIIECSVEDLSGVVSDEATIFENQKDGSKFPNFSELQNGSEIEANLWVKPTTGKAFLYPATANFKRTGGNKTANIEKFMDKKSENIEKFQNSKEEGIKVSSTMNKAVELAIAEKGSAEMNLEECISKWRRWLWLHWEDWKDYPPF